MGFPIFFKDLPCILYVKTELLPLLVIIDFPYGKLEKTGCLIFTINGIFLCTGKK